MHMKDDHMRNAQLKPGYNVQIAVDSEYIVATDIFQDRNDVWTLVCLLYTSILQAFYNIRNLFFKRYHI